MPAAPFDGIIFDMDGVLLHSEPAHVWAYEQLFAPFEITFTAQDFRRVALGVPRREVIRRVLGELDDEALARLMAQKAALVEQYLAHHALAPLEGVPALLEWLAQRELPTAVATTSRMPDPFLRAAGLDDLFEVVVCGRDVEHNKPAPDVYQEAARRIALDPSRGLAIEDSARGALAARRAGLTVWAVDTSPHTQDFEGVAHEVFADILEVAARLRGAHQDDPEGS